MDFGLLPYINPGLYCVGGFCSKCHFDGKLTEFYIFQEAQHRTDQRYDRKPKCHDITYLYSLLKKDYARRNPLFLLHGGLAAISTLLGKYYTTESFQSDCFNPFTFMVWFYWVSLSSTQPPSRVVLGWILRLRAVQQSTKCNNMHAPVLQDSHCDVTQVF